MRFRLPFLILFICLAAPAFANPDKAKLNPVLNVLCQSHRYVDSSYEDAAGKKHPRTTIKCENPEQNKLCPTGGSISPTSIVFGHFTAPEAEDVVIPISGCNRSHAENYGDVFVLTKHKDKGWQHTKTLESSANNMFQCRLLAYKGKPFVGERTKHDTDQLLCESYDVHQGYEDEYILVWSFYKKSKVLAAWHSDPDAEGIVGQFKDEKTFELKPLAPGEYGTDRFSKTHLVSLTADNYSYNYPVIRAHLRTESAILPKSFALDMKKFKAIENNRVHYPDLQLNNQKLYEIETSYDDIKAISPELMDVHETFLEWSNHSGKDWIMSLPSHTEQP